MIYEDAGLVSGVFRVYVILGGAYYGRYLCMSAKNAVHATLRRLCFIFIFIHQIPFHILILFKR